MHLSSLIVALATFSISGVLADTHDGGYCYSTLQPIGNDNVCGRKRDTTAWTRDIKLQERKNYGDNAAATKRACAAYRNRNTGNKQWDKCPDCHIEKKTITGESYCINFCVSNGYHIGGDELEYYCKQAGADGSYGY